MRFGFAILHISHLVDSIWSNSFYFIECVLVLNVECFQFGSDMEQFPTIYVECILVLQFWIRTMCFSNSIITCYLDLIWSNALYFCWMHFGLTFDLAYPGFCNHAAFLFLSLFDLEDLRMQKLCICVLTWGSTIWMVEFLSIIEAY